MYFSEHFKINNLLKCNLKHFSKIIYNYYGSIVTGEFYNLLIILDNFHTEGKDWVTRDKLLNTERGRIRTRDFFEYPYYTILYKRFNK